MFRQVPHCQAGLRPVPSLADEAVHRLPDEVGMAVVAGVLLDHVDQDVAQAG